MTTDADILRAAKALIDTPEKWTRGEFARTKLGGGCPVTTPDAACFCTLGAVYRAEGDRRGTSRWLASALGIRIGDLAANANGVIKWNDRRGRTHAEVMALFDRAIALAEQPT